MPGSIINSECVPTCIILRIRVLVFQDVSVGVRGHCVVFLGVENLCLLGLFLYEELGLVSRGGAALVDAVLGCGVFKVI